MNFWKNFKLNEKSSDKDSKSTLEKQISQLIPQADENKKMKIACLCGLLARVIFVDLKADAGEISSMNTVLKNWTSLTESEIEAIVSVSLEHSKQLAGLENQVYTLHLRKVLTGDQKYHLLECLFAIAASDGEASNQESEEIRAISIGLGLDQQHYIAARATVRDKLGALNK